MTIFDIIINCYFLTIGIYTGKNEKIRKLTRTVSLIVTIAEVVLTVGLIQAIVVADLKIYRIKLIASLICIIHYIILRHGCRVKNQLLIRLAKELRNKTAIDLLNYRNGKLKRILFLLIFTFFTSIIFIVFFSIPFIIIVKHLNPELDYNDPGYYLVPYLFKYWTVDSLVGYTLVHMFQYFCTVPIASSYILCNLFFFSTIANLLFRYKSMSKKLTRVIQSDMAIHAASSLHKHSDKLIDGFVLDHQYLNKFAICIQLMFVYLIVLALFFIENLHSYLHIFALVLRGPSTVSITGYTVSMILLNFSMKQVSIYSLDGFLAVFVGAFLGFGFFIYSYIGETIYNMNEILLDQIYFGEWYNFCPKVRKQLLIVMTRTHKQFEVKVFQMYLINLHRFAIVLKQIYVAVNVLTSVHNYKV